MKKITALSILLFAAARLLYAEIGVSAKSYEEGLRFKQQGLLIEAERSFLEALSRDPANADCHFELAGIYAAKFDSLKKSSDRLRAQEMLARAARSLEQALMIRPDFLAAHYNLGVIYKHQGRFEEAREEFRKVLEFQPAAVNAQVQLGSAYEEQGFFDEARDEYLKAREMDFTNPEIKFMLDDLERKKKESLAQSRSEAMKQSQTRQAQGNLGNNQELAEQGTTANQALPYLTSMLVQQFMNRWSERKEASDE